VVRRLDPARHCAVFADGRELHYDLFLAVPTHRAPRVVVDSGLTVDGWIPVDPETLATRWPDVYAVGDVTSVGTPKAGVFAEGQAGVVAEANIARRRGTSSSATYDGRGICYVEFGASGVAMVDVTFPSGQAPTGALDGPSADLAAVKREFERSRVERWFGGQPV
jgi:sulfide:quinone oxidoreductase